MRVLLHSDSPWYGTEHARQAALWAPRLARHHEVALSAYRGIQGTVPTYEGVRVLPALDSRYGNTSIAFHAATAFGGNPANGLVLTLLDPQVLDPAVWSKLNVVCWTAVAHEPAPPAVAGFLQASGAIPIATSRFGARQLERLDPLYVPFAVDTAVFKPESRAAARERTGLPADAFVAGVVVANDTMPSRASLPQILEAFAELRSRHDDALIYLHTDLSGRRGGGFDLIALINSLGIDEGAVRFSNQTRGIETPVPAEDMAGVYSALDVLVNPAMGEGFGLPVLEAQACGVPAIVTDFSAMSEVCGSGWKIGYERFWTHQRAWQARPRTTELVEALEAAYGATATERAELATQARDHALVYDADRVLVERLLPALAEAAGRLGLGELEERPPASGIVLPGGGKP